MFTVAFADRARRGYAVHNRVVMLQAMLPRPAEDDLRLFSVVHSLTSDYHGCLPYFRGIWRCERHFRQQVPLAYRQQAGRHTQIL